MYRLLRYSHERAHESTNAGANASPRPNLLADHSAHRPPAPAATTRRNYTLAAPQTARASMNQASGARREHKGGKTTWRGRDTTPGAGRQGMAASASSRDGSSAGFA